VKTKRKFQLASTALTAFAAFSAATALAQEKPKEPTELSKTVVSDTAENESTPSLATAAIAIADVPGAASIVDSSAVERGRVQTQADILASQPGVFAAPPAGSGDGIKISIRGSGIARSAGNFFRDGVLFTFDGLPVTGAGGTPYELFETYGLNYTEVLVGGNGYDFGALQLGGAINYVTHTGYDAPHAEIRYDFGSYSYSKIQASTAAVLGKADYYFSVASLHVTGFQQHSQGKSEGFAGNFGYKLTDKIDTRFFLRYRRTENASPGAISLNQLETDPRVANPSSILGDSYRTEPGSTWFANRTTIKIDENSKAELGIVYHNAPIDIQPKPSPGAYVFAPATGFTPVANPLASTERSIWAFQDITVQGKYTRTDELFGRHSTTTLIASFDDEPEAWDKTYAQNPNVTTGLRAYNTLLKYADYNNSIDSSARLINNTQINDQFSVITGLGVAYIRRAGALDYVEPGLPLAKPSTNSTATTIDRSNYYFVPRFGLSYNPDSHLNVFANVTRSIEPPNSWQLNHGSTGNYIYQDNIVDQKAIAFEVGSRASYEAFTGSIGLFRTNVRDELLTLPVDPTDYTKGSYTFNGSKTYKQGVEVGLDTNVWSQDGFFKAKKDGTHVVWNQTYTHSDFRYKDDPVYGHNQLPGVPRDNYHSGLRVDHSSGFYGGISYEFASSYYVDFANHLEAPSYGLWGANFGYENPKQHWSVYIDFHNIFDKKWASSAGPTLDAGPASVNRNNPLFYVGEGFSTTAGVTLRF